MKKLFYTIVLIISMLIMPLMAQATDLMQVFHDALANDPTFKAAQAEYLATRENFPIARAALLPNALITGQSQREYVDEKLAPFFTRGGPRTPNPNPLLTFYNNSNIYELDITQPIFDVAAWTALRGADYQVKAAEATFDAAAQDLMLRTAQAYFGVLQARDTLWYTLAQKKAVGQQLKQQQEQYEVGLIAITGLQEAQASYDSIVAEEIAARNNLATAVEQLRTITCKTYPDLMGADNHLPLMRPNPSNIENWVQTAEQQNYSLLAAVNTTNQAQENISTQNAGHLPVISATGSYNYDSESNGAVIGYTLQKTTAAGISLNFPVYQGGLINAQTRQAEDQYQQAISNMEFTHRSVIQQARDGYLGVITGIGQIRADRETVISSQTAMQATIEGYKVGTRTILDVLNTQSSLYQAEKTYSQDQYNYLISIITLKQAAGTLSPSDLYQMNSWLHTNFEIASEIASIDPSYAGTLGMSPPNNNRPIHAVKTINLAVPKMHSIKNSANNYSLSNKKPVATKVATEKTMQTGGNYTIELFDAKVEQHAKNFIDANHLQNKATFYQTTNAKGETRYQVVYGSYATQEQAQAALKKLSPKLQALHPWVRKLATVASE